MARLFRPHFAGALIARDQGDSADDVGRPWEFVITYDRETVLASARSLLARISRSHVAPTWDQLAEPVEHVLCSTA